MIHLAIPALVLGTVAFIAWTVASIVILRDLRRRAVSASGQAFPGPSAQIGALAQWWRDGSARGSRRAWAGLTVVVLALSALFWTFGIGR
ncbi:hypothetical protein VK792_07440 [Mesobacterium sp. TK19101]|uniref:Uncharacterized protein n=1 Tax=Mesobacterium hydrothermale TaxID=3111907 RepID=A0ABU6HFA0_9RHOB|nr:hypothetical protein [Mesobacterium sp. TK19101]MEC3861112.1 hypothetical protein [Mesobacterium sp. TK19101]